MIGRDREIERLRAISRDVQQGGRAVLLEGSPGLGKTTLLSSLGHELGSQGFLILSCSGNVGRVTEGYGALHELLHPIIGLATALPERQRAALMAAFGISDTQRPDRFLTHLAVLGLLEEAAVGQPVLVAVDDAHWVDQSSLDALLFVSRRLTRSALLVTFSVRPEEPTADILHEAPLETIVLSALGHRDARQVVEEVQPGLSDDAVRAVMRAADGNPLALTEFASASGRGISGNLATPVSQRVTETFLAGADSLPPGAQTLLLLVAVGGDLPVRELLAAGASLGATPNDLTAVETSGLAVINGSTLRFRHPLVGAAVLGGTSSAARRAAHDALSTTTANTGRAAWHRAEATLEADEQTAAQLEQAALAANQRGARSEAVSWLRRASALSVDAAAGVRRLAVAAEIAREAGLVNDAESLLREAIPNANEPDVVALLAAAELLFTLTTGRRGMTVAEKIAIAAQLAGDDGQAHGLERSAILLGVCARWHLQDGGPEPDPELKYAVEHLPQPGDNWIQILASAYLDPVGTAPILSSVLPGLVQAASDESLPGNVGSAGDPRWLFSVGLVAQLQQDLGTALAAWDAALRSSRLLSSGVDEAVTLCGRALCLLVMGQLAGALSDAEQAERLSRELELPFLVGMSSGVAAVVRATRGENTEAADAIQTARQSAAVAPSTLVSALAHWANGLMALHDGRFDDAWHDLREVAAHPPTSGWAIADQVEAAVRAGRVEEVLEELNRVARMADGLERGHWTPLVSRSRALLDDAHASAHFEAAVTAAPQETSPLEMAKSHLAYGAWLRRKRKVEASRSHLSRALELLTRLGAEPLITRTLAELRASGASVDAGDVGPRRDSAHRLTPQEWRVARLAAAGLTNAEIADQMFLSPRTVARHLFNAFPKLGIQQRAQLSAALLDS